MYDYALVTGFISLLALLVNFYHRLVAVEFLEALALLALIPLACLLFAFTHLIQPMGNTRKAILFGFVVTCAFLIGGIPHVHD